MVSHPLRTVGRHGEHASPGTVRQRSVAAHRPAAVVHTPSPGRSPEVSGLFLFRSTGPIRQGGLPMTAFLDDPPSPRPSGAGSARVPPHNLQAEESLLGAMLLSRDAIAVAVRAAERRRLLQAGARPHLRRHHHALRPRASRPTRSPWPTSCAGPACSRPSAVRPRWSTCRPPRRPPPTPAATPRSSRSTRCSAG